MNQKNKMDYEKKRRNKIKGNYETETACIVFGGRWNDSSIVIWGC